MKRLSLGRAVLVALLAGLCLSHAPAAEGEGKAERIALPKARRSGGMSVEETLAQRRSVRRYDARSLTLEEVSQLLWSAQGITATRGRRTTPSAGALYPIEMYLAAGRVSGLPAGVYHYLPQEHALERVRTGDVRDDLYAASLKQPWVKEAPAVLAISIVPARTEAKYGPRARRYVDMEVGCVCQSVHLQCESLGLGTVAIGAFDDKTVAGIIGAPPTPRLLMPVGAKVK